MSSFQQKNQKAQRNESKGRRKKVNREKSANTLNVLEVNSARGGREGLAVMGEGETWVQEKNIIESISSDHNRMILEVNNRRKTRKIHKTVGIKQLTFKQLVDQRINQKGNLKILRSQ